MRILVMANRDFVLYNFRFELLEELRKKGHEVYVYLPYGPKVKSMEEIGCIHINMDIDRRGKNPFHDFKLMREYERTFKKIHPDVILTYTTKVGIYAGIVATRMKIPYIDNVSGLGTALEYRSILQKLMIFLTKKSVKGASCVFFQNTENEKFFKDHNINCPKSRLIPGSGVNLKKWHLMEYPGEEKGVHFLFIARVIKEKGIEQYLYTAKHIKKIYPNAVFHVLGPCDGDYKEILEKYEQHGIIRYHGMVQDTQSYLEKAHCTIHPSYYPEGISNVLLESASSGRPVITTNRSGCRETVEDGQTGFIVKQKDNNDLCKKVCEFINLPWKKKRDMGLKGHNKIKKEFDRQMVIESYLQELDDILQEKEI